MIVKEALKSEDDLKFSTQCYLDSSFSLVELSSVGNTAVKAGQNGKDRSYSGQFGGLAVDMGDSLKTKSHSSHLSGFKVNARGNIVNKSYSSQLCGLAVDTRERTVNTGERKKEFKLESLNTKKENKVKVD